MKKYYKMKLTKKTKAVVLVSRDGIAIPVYLDLKKNTIQSIVKGTVPYLRKIGWYILKKESRGRC